MIDFSVVVDFNSSSSLSDKNLIFPNVTPPIKISSKGIVKINNAGINKQKMILANTEKNITVKLV